MLSNGHGILSTYVSDPLSTSGNTFKIDDIFFRCTYSVGVFLTNTNLSAKVGFPLDLLMHSRFNDPYSAQLTHTTETNIAKSNCIWGKKFKLKIKLSEEPSLHPYFSIDLLFFLQYIVFICTSIGHPNKCKMAFKIDSMRFILVLVCNKIKIQTNPKSESIKCIMNLGQSECTMCTICNEWYGKCKRTSGFQQSIQYSAPIDLSAAHLFEFEWNLFAKLCAFVFFSFSYCSLCFASIHFDRGTFWISHSNSFIKWKPNT